MNEKVFKTLNQIGASGIVVGILCMAVGISLGVLTIINGARALSARKKYYDLIFGETAPAWIGRMTDRNRSRFFRNRFLRVLCDGRKWGY